MKPKRTALAVIGLVPVLVLAAFIAWPMLHYGYNFSDSLACLVTTGQHATSFAPGYSDAAFSKLRLGMSYDEVRRLLGEPLHRDTVYWPDYGWKYSAPASSSGHYHLREVRFTQDGKVGDCFSVFYFD